MIYAIADIHGIPIPDPPDDAEVVLVVGDICPDFDPFSPDKGVPRQAAWLDTIWREWLDERKADGIQVVGIWGNHDFVGEKPEWVPGLPWTLLHDTEVMLDTSDGPLRVYGTCWVPGLPRWAFYATKGALEARAAAIPSGLDILMTHGPPYGAGDYVPGGSGKQANKYGNFDGQRVGDRYLGDAIERARPRITVCGHIHEDRGPHKLYARWVVENVAGVDGYYEPYDDPWVKLL